MDNVIVNNSTEFAQSGQLIPIDQNMALKYIYGLLEEYDQKIINNVDTSVQFNPYRQQIVMQLDNGKYVSIPEQLHQYAIDKWLEATSPNNTSATRKIDLMENKTDKNIMNQNNEVNLEKNKYFYGQVNNNDNENNESDEKTNGDNKSEKSKKEKRSDNYFYLFIIMILLLIMGYIFGMNGIFENTPFVNNKFHRNINNDDISRGFLDYGK